jgi:hypothetical protein
MEERAGQGVDLREGRVAQPRRPEHGSAEQLPVLFSRPGLRHQPDDDVVGFGVRVARAGREDERLVADPADDARGRDVAARIAACVRAKPGERV